MSFSKWASIASARSSFETQILVLPFYTAMLGTKEMAFRFCFRISEQYMVKTKSDDALKILIAREKMANRVVRCQYAMCRSLRSSFLKLFIFH